MGVKKSDKQDFHKQEREKNYLSYKRCGGERLSKKGEVPSLETSLPKMEYNVMKKGKGIDAPNYGAGLALRSKGASPLNAHAFCKNA